MSETNDAPATADDELPLSKQDDDSVIVAITRDVEAADKRQLQWRKDAEEDFAFIAGDQWSEEDEAKLREEGRPPVTFNRLGTLIDAVCGSQVNNRQEMDFLPRTVDDQGKADIVKGVVRWARDQCDAEDEESDAFRDLAVCGMAWLVNRVDYSEDPSGQYVKDRVSPLEMRWDPAARKRNLIDRRWQAHLKRVPRDSVEAQWPGATGMLTDGSSPGTSRDTVVLPQRDRYGQHEDDNAGDDGTVEVIEYQWREVEAVWAVNINGRAEYLDAPRYEAFREANEGKTTPKVVRLGRAKWFRAVVCGDQMLERGECPDPTDASYQCMTGKRDEISGTFYGIVRGLKDPQRWANKWLAQSMHILNTSAKSGLLVEEGAITDQKAFEESYAKAGSVSTVAPGALANGRIQPKQSPGMPAGFHQLLQFAVMSIPDVSGINREVLGLADREQAGILEAQRKQAAQAVMAPLFDALRLYYKRDGRQVARLVKAYIPPDKMMRIVMGDAQQPTQVTTAMMPDVDQFDIVVDEAPTSPNQKSEVWQMLAPTLPALMKAGIPPPVWVELLQFSPLPDASVAKLRELLTNMQQQQAQQPDPEVVKMEMQAKADEARLAFEKQKNDQDMQMEVMRFQLEQQKAQFQLEHEAQKLEFQKQAETQKMAIQRDQAAQSAELRAYEVHTSAEAQKASALPGIVKPLQETVTRTVETVDALAAEVSKIADQQAQTAQMLQQVAQAVAGMHADMQAPVEIMRGQDGRVSGARRGSREISLMRPQ